MLAVPCVHIAKCLYLRVRVCVCTCTHIRLNVLFEIDACMRARVFIHITTIVMRRRMYRNARSLVWSSPRNSWNAACIHLRSVLLIEHRFSSFEIVQVHVIQFFLAYCSSFEVIVLVALPSTLCSWRPFQFPMRSSFIKHHLNSFAICSRVAGDNCSAFVYSITAVRT